MPHSHCSCVYPRCVPLLRAAPAACRYAARGGAQVYGTQYNSTMAVLVTEALKLPLSFILLAAETRSVPIALLRVHADVLCQPAATARLAVPALLYTIQNNVLFVAVSHLEAAVFQVTYQLKTLTTAACVVAMTSRKIHRHQWGALLVLMCGTVLVQEPAKAVSGSESASSFAIGIGATLAACLCSSFASVYLETILHEKSTSIWIRNVQLCVFTLPIAWVGTLMVEDPIRVSGGGLLHGFSPTLWCAIATNAAGGMIVAAVMKYAGNILRSFAQACLGEYSRRILSAE